MNCPTATYDIKFNLKNRNWAIKNVDYGPANPEEDNEEYWQNLADMWTVSIDEVQEMRCGNCAAFIQTPKMLACIESGLETDSDMDAWEVIDAGDLGYCEVFDFKCASKRTCEAWISGGPITEEENHGH